MWVFGHSCLGNFYDFWYYLSVTVSPSGVFCFVLFSVCNPGYPVTCYIKPVWPWTHRAPPAPTSWALVLKACATTPGNPCHRGRAGLWWVAPAGRSGQISVRSQLPSIDQPEPTFLIYNLKGRVIITRISYDYYNGNDLIDRKPLAAFPIVYGSANGN